MDPKNQRRPASYGRGNSEHSYRSASGSSRGYGYGGGYGGYGYGGYGYGGYGGGYGRGSETTLQKTLDDYLLVLRERIWYIVVAFLLVLGAAAIYSFTRTPVYQSVATIEIFRRTPTVMMQAPQVEDTAVASPEDLNTQVGILKSSAIIQAVGAQITGDKLARFMAPYQTPGQPLLSVFQILQKNRDIIPERLSLIIDAVYHHPDGAVAADVANMFADAYIAYNANVRVDESMKAVEELRQRADEQRQKVDGIAAAIQAYREKNNMVSLDERQDIVTEALKDLNKEVTESAAVLQEAETRWKQVNDNQRVGGDLLDLPFIATIPAVSQLQQQVATQKILVAQLAQRYRAKHPQMISAQSLLDEAERQLRLAINTSVAQVQTEYQNALQNYAKAQAALAGQETDSLKLDRYGLEYSNLERDLQVNEKILEEVLDLERVRQADSSGTIENENARIVDHAMPSSKPYYPNYTLNLGLGAIGGLALGLALAFFVAYTDDRVKSAFDIETVVGLQLVGILPKVSKLGDPGEMEKTLSAGREREVSEAFSSLLSSLQLKDESRKAKCILVTSTVAGEGKTFISTHLAQAYATHGERTVIVDCDLRRPAVNRVFHLENLKGVIDVCSSSATLDDVIIKDVRPNLDVIPSGGRSKNPTQILSSKEFAVFVSDLRKRYDRVLIDTPPVAIVSDAMLVLPLVDGSLYAIFFNKARRKSAQFCAQRLLESNVPSFGAVLNGLSGGIGGYYYSHYYDRSYRDYYVSRADGSNGNSSHKVAERPENPGAAGRS